MQYVVSLGCTRFFADAFAFVLVVGSCGFCLVLELSGGACGDWGFSILLESWFFHWPFFHFAPNGNVASGVQLRVIKLWRIQNVDWPFPSPSGKIRSTEMTIYLTCGRGTSEFLRICTRRCLSNGSVSLLGCGPFRLQPDGLRISRRAEGNHTERKSQCSSPSCRSSRPLMLSHSVIYLSTPLS